MANCTRISRIKFNQAGVEICSPNFAALRDGNRIAIPDSYVPKTYTAPGFRLFAPAISGSTAEQAVQSGS
jgi:hypothetical protein